MTEDAYTFAPWQGLGNDHKMEKEKLAPSFSKSHLRASGQQTSKLVARGQAWGARVTAWAKFMTSIVYYVTGVCCHLHNNLHGRCPVNNKEGGSVMSKVILVAVEAEAPD